MGWKGFVRSAGAAIRRAEREAERQQRANLKADREAQKEGEREAARATVQSYNEYIEQMTSLHKSCSKSKQWKNSIPSEPVRQPDYENEARRRFDNYSPGLFTRLLGRSEKVKAKLNEEINRSAKKDEQEYQRQLKDYKKRVEKNKLAKRILNGDIEAYKELIKIANPFQKIANLGSNITIDINDPNVLEAVLNVHSDEVIPDELYSLRSNGTLSEKKLPKGKFYEIYQDYICSCVIRVARELFAILPINKVIVTAQDDLLDTKIGNKSLQPILSVYILKETLESMNMEYIDPSDSMVNFKHNMKFKKTKGFMPVKKLTLEEVTNH